LLFFSIFVFLAVCQFGKPKLWGRFTNVGKSGERTIDHCVKIDLESDTYQIVSNNYIYVGGSATVDGISTFDQTRGVFYYTTDGSTRSVFQVQVTTGTLLPTIDFYAYAIGALKFDHVQSRLIVAYYNQQKLPVLALYSVNEGPISTVPLQPGVQLGNAAYDGKKQLYYNAVYAGSANKTIINTINVQSGATNTATITCPGYVINMFINNFKGSESLWGLMEYFTPQNQLKYYIAEITPNKNSQCNPILLPTTGIVTASTFSESTGSLVYNEAINGGDLIHEFNVKTRQTKAPNIGIVLEDLQIQHR